MMEKSCSRALLQTVYWRFDANTSNRSSNNLYIMSMFLTS